MSAFDVNDDDLSSNHSNEEHDLGLEFSAYVNDDDFDDLGDFGGSGLSSFTVNDKKNDSSRAVSPKPDQQELETNDGIEQNETEIGATLGEETNVSEKKDSVGDQRFDQDKINANSKSQNSNKDDDDKDPNEPQLEEATRKPTEVADDSDLDESHKAADQVEQQEDDIESSQNKKRRLVFSSDEEDEGEEESTSKIDQDQEDNKDEEEEKTANKSAREILGSDSEDDNEENEEKKTSMLNDIFGDDSDGELVKPDEQLEAESGELPKVPDYDEDEPRFLRVEDSDGERQESDFDLMMSKKRAEKRKKRRRKDGSIDLISDADDQIKALVDAMVAAANNDRTANAERKPAVQKLKMLPVVKHTLLKADYFDALLDNGMMSAVSEWLAPLPDKSLPALEIRSVLLKILSGFPTLEQGILKQSGLGKAVMFLFKHPKETRENKSIASKLIRDWARPIFQLDSDYSSLSREERIQRDYEHMPQSKRQKLILQEDGTISPSKRPTTSKAEEAQPLHPGDKGFIPRARVPKPSTKDYVIRPKPKVEARYKGESKSRANSKLERTTREFQARNKALKVKRAVGVSIEGRQMEL